MSRRLKITLPDPVCAQLDEMAANSGEPVSRLAARIVLSGVVQSPGKEYPLGGGHSRAANRRQPCWLEPPVKNAEWRSQMWGAIVALHNRYPRELADLNDHWWESGSLVETLCALAIWRRRIDESGLDPREELAFQTGLSDCSSSLTLAATRTMRPWNPGPPPADWSAHNAESCPADDPTPDRLATEGMAYFACGIDRPVIAVAT
jgi:CopG-like RHH_1 or ribbon-helix-helix domain, RHH_5